MGVVRLYGDLQDHLPKKLKGKFKCAYNSIAEAIAALEANFPGFYELIRTRQLQVTFGKKKNNPSCTIGEDNLEVCTWEMDCDVHIMPALQGGKNTGKIIIGAVLVVIAIAIAVGTLGTGTPLSATILGGAMTIGGLALSLGVMGLGMLVAGLAPSPTMNDFSADDITTKGKTSSVYSGPLNTQELGGPVPVCIGNDVLAGGVVIHGMLTIEQLVNQVGWD